MIHKVADKEERVERVKELMSLVGLDVVSCAAIRTFSQAVSDSVSASPAPWPCNPNC